jgi:phosphatidylglycerophosphate synthase
VVALIQYRLAANVLTAARAVASVLLIARPSLALVAFAIATDWIDGSLARRGGQRSYGARFDLEADSLLTLGTAIAAVRSGAPMLALVAPVARYAVVGVRDPATLSRGEVFLDRATGAPLMAVLIAWLAPSRFSALRGLIGPVTLARCAAIGTLATPSAVHLGHSRRPAEPRLVLSTKKEDR